MSFGDGVQLSCTCSACPEQYEGTVDGNPAYFRLRHSHWRFCIMEPGGNPVRPGLTPEKRVLYYNEGMIDDDDVGAMDDAPSFIMKMILEFRVSRAKTKDMREADI